MASWWRTCWKGKLCSFGVDVSIANSFSWRFLGCSANMLGHTYSQLLSDSGGTLHGAGLEGEHRFITLSMQSNSISFMLRDKILSRVLWLGTQGLARAYVETSQAASVAVEGVVVEVNELFCWKKVSRVRIASSRYGRWLFPVGGSRGARIRALAGLFLCAAHRGPGARGNIRAMLVKSRA